MRTLSFTARLTPWDITTRAASLLGGAQALGMKPRNSIDWVYLIRKGFPSLELDAISRNINATNAELAQILGISSFPNKT